jgi:hypothetical protein
MAERSIANRQRKQLIRVVILSASLLSLTPLLTAIRSDAATTETTVQATTETASVVRTNDSGTTIQQTPAQQTRPSHARTRGS